MPIVFCKLGNKKENKKYEWLIDATYLHSNCQEITILSIK